MVWSAFFISLTDAILISLTPQSVITKTNIFAYVPNPQKGMQVPPDSETVSLSLFDDDGYYALNETDDPIEIFIGKASF